jgi:DNA-binding Lrp family transcriptional regulator
MMTDRREHLDSYDLKILHLLAAEGRMTWRELADAIGLSLTPTLRRVRRLESAGYIQGYSAVLDERRLSGALGAFVSVAALAAVGAACCGVGAPGAGAAAEGT